MIHRAHRTLYRDTTGAAQVEAIVMLPFFLIILAGLYFVQALYAHRLDAQTEARAAAWRYAIDGCRGQQARAGAAGHETLQVGVEQELGEIGGFANLPVINEALTGIFSKATQQRVTRDVERPSLYGGGTRQVTGRFYLLCNEVPRDLGDVVADSFHHMWGRYGPG